MAGRFARIPRLATGLVLVLGATACSGDDDASGDAGATTALFELPGADGMTSEFYALPFPNDLRRDADGTISFTGHVMPNDLLVDYFKVFETLEGFGTSSPVLFRFSAALDPASLPSTPAASLEEGGAAYLVDVDPDSSDRGRLVPVRFRFEPNAGEAIGENWLSILPQAGFPLRESTTYAAVVTHRVRDGNGQPVGSSADWETVARGEAATPEYAPLLAWLDETGGDERADVAAAAVFTTQDCTSVVKRARAVLYRDHAAPTARDVALATTSTAAFNVYVGVYDAPSFQSGAVPYMKAPDGQIVLDPAGDPVVQRQETIRFAVAVPTGTAPAGGWPIVLYAHGTGGDRQSFVRDGTAGRLAAEGLATISIDANLNAQRNAMGNPELDFFNFFNPAAGRDNARQGAIDQFTLLRLVGGLTVGAGQTFDVTRATFMGHSQGGLAGPPFLAFEPGTKGSVLSGAGGIVTLSLLLKTEPIDVTAILASVIRDVPLDEFNNLVGLVQTYLDPADPINYARYLIDEPVDGMAPKDIFMSEGFVDNFTPTPAIEALGLAMGLSPVRPVIRELPAFEQADRATLDAPVSANQNGATGVFLQYEAPTDRDGHFVVFDVPAAQRQHAKFLGSVARDGRATLVP